MVLDDIYLHLLAPALDCWCNVQEQEMLRLRDVHEREMTKLRYELEQARTEGW